jgi:hypothetical protein
VETAFRSSDDRKDEKLAGTFFNRHRFDEAINRGGNVRSPQKNATWARQMSRLSS